MKRLCFSGLFILAIFTLTSVRVATAEILSGGTEVKVLVGDPAVWTTDVAPFGGQASVSDSRRGQPIGPGGTSGIGTLAAEGLSVLRGPGGIGNLRVSQAEPVQYPRYQGSVHTESNTFIEFSPDAAGTFLGRGAKSSHPFGSRLLAYVNRRMDGYPYYGLYDFTWNQLTEDNATMSFSYTPGYTYRVQLQNGIDVCCAITTTTSVSGTWIWGFNALPGGAATNPLPVGSSIGTADIPDTSIPDPETEPTAVTGGYLTGLPIDGDYGRTAAIYVGDPPPSSPTPPELAAIAYGFFSQGLNITSVTLPPALPNGDSEFELLIDETLYPVTPGSVFDFTSLVPEGIESFALLGIDPAEGFDPAGPLPFPVGLQFAGDGLTQLYTLTYSPVPPGDFDADGDVDGRDFLLWQRNPSVGELADWQGNYGAGSLVASMAVPEPRGFWLAGLYVWLWKRR